MHPRIVKDPYQVLGIPTTASVDDIRQAYIELALRWHPDRHVGDKEHATKIFFEISHAYQALAGELDFSSVPGASQISSMFTILPTRSGSQASAGSTISLTSPSRVFTIRSSNASFLQTTSTSSLCESVIPPPKPSTRETHASRQRNVHQSSVNTQTTDGLRKPEVLIGRARTGNTRPLPRSQFEFRTQGASTEGQLKQQTYTFSAHAASDVAYDRPAISAAPVVKNNLMSLRVGPPLRPLVVGTAKKWIYPVILTLEELFSGKRCRLCVVRRLNSGKTRNVLIELDITPGCQQGTRILCREVGHQLPDGSLQDLVFTIEEATHDRFTRFEDDLFLDIRIPWTEDLRRQPKRVGIRGLDGEELSIYVEYARDKMLTGSYGIRGAGMPIRRQGEVSGRGNLVVRWEILPPTQTRIQRFFSRFFYMRGALQSRR